MDLPKDSQKLDLSVSELRNKKREACLQIAAILEIFQFETKASPKNIRVDETVISYIGQRADKRKYFVDFDFDL